MKITIAVAYLRMSRIKHPPATPFMTLTAQ